MCPSPDASTKTRRSLARSPWLRGLRPSDRPREDDLDDIPTEESPGTHIDDDMLRHTMHFEGMPRHGGDGEDRDDGGLGGLFEATRRTSL